MTPVIFRPFSKSTARDIERHVREVRRIYDWPGAPYHVENPEQQFNRWSFHNLPLLVQAHRTPSLIAKVSKCFEMHLSPSYVFLSMYGADGVCPEHVDRPQCFATVDYMVSTDAKDKPWPIYIDGGEYCLQPGEAVLYSGTGQRHHRNPMHESSDGTYANLAFFHFVPSSFMGNVR